MTAVDSAQFHWPVRVYIEDTDAGGIVYHARYLHFMERARTEWVRSQGIALRRGLDENVSYVVQKMAIQFRQPAKLDDELWVTAVLTGSGRVWFGFDQKVIRQSDGAVLAEADVKVACVALDSGRPRALPESMQAIVREQ
ncbi:tol-pal system-associated acyl-CoA thioesterase [Marinobacter bohaiensis]|uniref:tol-pal system-associated acyl-CoA thioesterase n=1 Tax=Marinobacter bohaiensis TaxID=2201898 RepID=UPI000DAB8323|nr:tol-pal system-associated acyl-CoA thioesterase [Marinobacter bohaiensis]